MAIPSNLWISAVGTYQLRRMFQDGNPWVRLDTAVELKSHHGRGAMNVATDLAAYPGPVNRGAARIWGRKHSMKQAQQFWRKSESLGLVRHSVSVTAPESLGLGRRGVSVTAL